MDTFAIIVLVAVAIAVCIFVYRGIQKTLNEKEKPVHAAKHKAKQIKK